MDAALQKKGSIWQKKSKISYSNLLLWSYLTDFYKVDDFLSGRHHVRL